jgi:hypothetical protein
MSRFEKNSRQRGPVILDKYPNSLLYIFEQGFAVQALPFRAD